MSARGRNAKGRFEKKSLDVSDFGENTLADTGGNPVKQASGVVSATASRLLSTKDVCDIIGVCAASRVATLNFRDLSVTFGDQKPPASKPAGVVGEPTAEDLAEARRQRARTQVEAQEAEVMGEIEAEDFELEQLKVTDPAEWERRVLNQEVTG